jgi:hypothetical protein
MRWMCRCGLLIGRPECARCVEAARQPTPCCGCCSSGVLLKQLQHRRVAPARPLIRAATAPSQRCLGLASVLGGGAVHRVRHTGASGSQAGGRASAQPRSKHIGRDDKAQQPTVRRCGARPWYRQLWPAAALGTGGTAIAQAARAAAADVVHAWCRQLGLAAHLAAQPMYRQLGPAAPLVARRSQRASEGELCLAR